MLDPHGREYKQFRQLSTLRWHVKGGAKLGRQGRVQPGCGLYLLSAATLHIGIVYTLLVYLALLPSMVEMEYENMVEVGHGKWKS